MKKQGKTGISFQRLMVSLFLVLSSFSLWACTGTSPVKNSDAHPTALFESKETKSPKVRRATVNRFHQKPVSWLLQTYLFNAREKSLFTFARRQYHRDPVKFLLPPIRRANPAPGHSFYSQASSL